MTKYTVVQSSQVDFGNRIDAEYYQPEFFRLTEVLEDTGAKSLNYYCVTTGSAFYPAARHLYETGDVPFLRCVDCISFPVVTARQHARFEKLPAGFADEHNNIKRLSRGDIVLTKVGTPCYASIIHDIDDVALSRTVLGLRAIKGIDPYYLVAFLRSKYGFQQLRRQREQTIQFQLTLERVNSVLVFKPSDPMLEELVARCLLIHETTAHRGDCLYREAQELLLSETGLADWQPNRETTSVRRLSAILGAGRMDSEYFRPKYDEMVQIIKGYDGGCDALGNLVDAKKCIEVGRMEYLDEGIPFVRVSNLTPFEITEEEYISEELYSQIRHHQPKQGEILLSKDGTPGIAHHLDTKPPKMIPSGGILRLARKSHRVNDEYLALALNSMLTREQVNRDVGGSVILHWRPDQVDRTLVPILPEYKQVEIQRKVAESVALRRQSRKLLEQGKEAVEIAIEQDEATAIEWLECGLASFATEV